MDLTIVRASIHPGIGIARVGNSQDEFNLGPSTPWEASKNTWKDASGAIKRQAAQFRIYGYNQAGEVVKEITTADAEIRWTVHVANTKASWYRFDSAMDISIAQPSMLRNAIFTGEARKQLEIDPGPVSIEGPSQSGPQYELNGTFVTRPVYLGELRTDDQGRLIFLGGRGLADSPFENNPAYTFANNDGWFDDISDGPVNAQVTLNGQTAPVPVEPAWVVTAPPNYAPDIVSIQTMWDVLYDTYVNAGWFAAPETPDFTQNILPLLNQFVNMQWVNYGMLQLFGEKGPWNFTSEQFIERLAIPDKANDEIRQIIFEEIRNPAGINQAKRAWPLTIGDAAGAPGHDAMMSFTPTVYGMLEAWAQGSFTSTWPKDLPDPSKSVDDFPVDQQPGLLDKAALWFCMGGPFHPGTELTWPMRTLTVYARPFRIRPRSPLQPEFDLGDTLTPQAALGAGGPLYGQPPGGLTRWLAVPWHTDTSSCASGYPIPDPDFPARDPYLPTWWPARVPNHVLADQHYKALLSSQTTAERFRIFQTRSVFMRALPEPHIERMNQMIRDFGKLGIVERRTGLADPVVPDVLYVETGGAFEGLEDIPSDKGLRLESLHPDAVSAKRAR